MKLKKVFLLDILFISKILSFFLCIASFSHVIQVFFVCILLVETKIEYRSLHSLRCERTQSFVLDLDTRLQACFEETLRLFDFVPEAQFLTKYEHIYLLVGGLLCFSFSCCWW